jgi:menaquinone-specific isochorismate synthase
MKIIETDRHRKPSLEDLQLLLEACRDEAEEDGHFKLVSISILARHMDPLAVLESIYEPSEWHFYLENPGENIAIAGADAVVLGAFQGEDRFAAARRWSDEVLQHTIALGDLQHSFAGPHFFGGFSFAADESSEDVTATGFADGTLFLPRWQVARKGWDSVAVANIRIDPDSDIEALGVRVWSAYQKFSSFNYSAPSQPDLKQELESFQPEPAEAYRQRVLEALRQIEAGAYQKIVLARKTDFNFAHSFDALQTLNLLRNRYPACFSFSICNGKGTTFFGATPERLMRVTDGLLETVAIAGSEPRGKTAQEDAQLARALLTSDKDHREHQHVVDSIGRRLIEAGASQVRCGKSGLLQLSNVQHLITPIEADLAAELHILDAAAVLHPTPAVGGTPRESACADIRKLEPFPRGLYAGIIGWFNHRGDGDFAVGLRSALARDNQVSVYAGAGIVHGSDPDKEFRETEIKMKALVDVITATDVC